MDNQQLQENTELFRHLFVAVGQTVMRILERTDRGMTPLQAVALMTVYTHPGKTMTQLASEMGIANAQLTRLIAGMERLDLVARQHNPDNRREVQVMRTAHGDTVAEQNMRDVEQVMDVQLAKLSGTERDELSKHLHAIIATLAKVGIVERPRDGQ